MSIGTVEQSGMVRLSGTARGSALPEVGDVAGGLAFARSSGRVAPLPGAGRTRELWRELERLAAHDVGLARTVEPHLDALAILAQAGAAAEDGTSWGVFAAEGGDEPLTATRTDSGWRLDGVKPWCSLADRLDAALVTAHVEDDRALFLVRLSDPGITVLPARWHARGLTEIPSGPVRFTAVGGRTVGAPGWYLERPGFAWGGMAVAACWQGGAVGVARALFAAAQERGSDPLLLLHLGEVDAALEDGRRALDEAARRIDEGTATGSAGALLAKRVRMTVARAVETTLEHVGHALGPGPLVDDAEHAKRVADLQLYVRQHHAERDAVSLGRELTRGEAAPW